MPTGSNRRRIDKILLIILKLIAYGRKSCRAFAEKAVGPPPKKLWGRRRKSCGAAVEKAVGPPSKKL